jgi:hypothetical protein
MWRDGVPRMRGLLLLTASESHWINCLQWGEDKFPNRKERGTHSDLGCELCLVVFQKPRSDIGLLCVRHFMPNLLPEIFPDRIGRLPDASLLDQLSGHRHRQVGARSRSESFPSGTPPDVVSQPPALKNSFVPAKPSPVDAKLTIPSRTLLLRTCGRLSLRSMKGRSSLPPVVPFSLSRR